MKPHRRRPHRRLRRGGADRGAEPCRDAQGRGDRQGRARRRRDRLGAGRNRRGAGGRRQLRSPCQRHDDRRRRAERPRASSSMSSSRRPRAIAASDRPRRAFRAAGIALHLTREGGHSHRRIVHVADATGWAVQQALKPRRPKHPNITLVPDMVAIDLVTGRHATHFSTSGAVHGLYAYNRKKKRVETLTGTGDDPRHRRRGPRLSLFDRAARRDRRRHRHGVAGGLPRLQHGDHAVPPDLPLQSARSRTS